MAKRKSTEGNNNPWKPSRCRLNGFHVWLIERQTGPCLRDDYELSRDADGNLREFSNERDASMACAELETTA